MIYGDIHQPEAAGLPAGLQNALRQALALAPHALSPGRHEFGGDAYFMNVMHYSTQLPDTKKAELHREYVDVQLVLSGKNSFITARREARGNVTSGMMTRIISCVSTSIISRG